MPAFIQYDTSEPAHRNFRVDRIQAHHKTDETFTKPEHGSRFFEAGKHVNQSFMMHSGDTVVRAVIKVEPWLNEYLESKFPLHTFLRNDGDQEVYQVTVSQEDSLLFWLLQQRTWAEVLSPQSLRDKLKLAVTDMARLYGIL